MLRKGLAWVGTRRERRVLQRFLIALALVPLFVPAQGGSAASQKPNIVVVMLDDLDHGTVQRILDGTGGLSTTHFPNLAALAARGVFGRRAFANAVSCCPSRATFLLGEYPSQTKLWSNADGEYYEPDPGAASEPIGGGYREFLRRGHESHTIAVDLNPTYRTIAAGKYLNGYRPQVLRSPTRTGTCADGSSRVSTPPGWNAWFGLMRDPEHNTNGYSSYDGNVNGCVRRVDTRNPQRFLRDIIRFSIDEVGQAVNAGEPFFLYLTPRNVHSVTKKLPGQLWRDVYDSWLDRKRLEHYEDVRYYARCGDRPYLDDADDVYDGTPEDCSDLYSFNEGRKPQGLLEKAPWAAKTQVWRRMLKIDRTFRSRLASLEAFDEALGKLIRAIAARGELGNTYLFLTSDQGFRLYEHGLRFGKNTPYDEDMRIPFVATGPGVAPTRDFRPMISMVDLHATIEQIAGLTPSGPGLPFLDALHGGADAGRDYVFAEGVRGETSDVPKLGMKMYKFQVIRTRSEKFIWTRTLDPRGRPIDGTDHYEIYDLVQDPREMAGRAPTTTELLVFRTAINRCASGACPPTLVA